MTRYCAIRASDAPCIVTEGGNLLRAREDLSYPEEPFWNEGDVTWTEIDARPEDARFREAFEALGKQLGQLIGMEYMAPPDARYYLVTVEEKCGTCDGGAKRVMVPRAQAPTWWDVKAGLARSEAGGFLMWHSPNIEVDPCPHCRGTGTITRPELWEETDERLEIPWREMVPEGDPPAGKSEVEHWMAVTETDHFAGVLIVRDGGSRERVMR